MIRIIYFLEDRAQESLITGLVDRIAGEVGVRVTHEVRSARGGSRALRDFKNFVKDLKLGKKERNFELLIVGVDADCKDYWERLKEVKRSAKTLSPEVCLLGCIPDPYIERWYLIDTKALKRVVGRDLKLSPPPYHCKKGKRGKAYYKQLLGSALKEVGSLLSGPEYGDLLAQEISLSLLARHDRGFKRFVTELRQFFQSRRP